MTENYQRPGKVRLGFAYAFLLAGIASAAAFVYTIYDDLCDSKIETAYTQNLNDDEFPDLLIKKSDGSSTFLLWQPDGTYRSKEYLEKILEE